MSSPLRYQLTENGVSPRWVPGSRNQDGEFLPNFFANGDEHNELGSVDESAANAVLMANKRLAKHQTILLDLPEPELFGPTVADISFVGFGSSRAVILDLINFLAQKQMEISGGSSTQDNLGQLGQFVENPNELKTNLYQKLGFQSNLWQKAPEFSINYLHFSYLWPLKLTKFQEFITANVSHGSKICLIEGNATGQLGTLITSQIGYTFPHKFLKYDGRQFFLEDLLSFIQTLS